MKRFYNYFLYLLLITAILTIGVLATSSDAYTYRSDELGFTLTIPKDLETVIDIVPYENGLKFIHKPSDDEGDRGFEGQMFYIEKHESRNKYLSEIDDDHKYEYHKIIAMTKDSVYTRVVGIWGGADFSAENRAEHHAASSRLSMEYLRENLVFDNPDSFPQIIEKSEIPYIIGENEIIQSDNMVTRGEYAELLYSLLIAENKGD